MMKAMYIDAPGQVSIKDVEMPVRKEGEVLLKILYGGICGSDLGSYRGTFAYFDYPRIPGHEFSAEVIEADENNAYGIKPGMIVTCNPYFNCGHCYSCEHGIVNACMDNQTMGCQRDGAFRSTSQCRSSVCMTVREWTLRHLQQSSRSASATMA